MIQGTAEDRLTGAVGVVRAMRDHLREVASPDDDRAKALIALGNLIVNANDDVAGALPRTDQTKEDRHG